MTGTQQVTPLDSGFSQAPRGARRYTDVQVAPNHVSEEHRLRALRALEVLDTDAEERFDRLTDLVAIMFDVPIALVSLVDEDRQWFKSHHGVAARQTPRDLAFCAHAIVDDDTRGPFVVADASLDARFDDNPLVAGDPNIRFYAGQVLLSPDGLPVGTLCAIDRRPRVFDETQRRALAHLAILVEDELHGQRAVRHSIRIAASERNKSLILDAVSEGLMLHGDDGALIDWNPAAERLLGLTWDELGERTSADPRFVLVNEDGSPMLAEARPSAIAMRTGQRVDDVICGLDRPRGARIWLKASAEPIETEHGARQVVSTFTDVTTEVAERRERRRLERDVRRQARRAQVSLDALDQGVLLVDNTGRISVANDAAERILGFTSGEITDRWQNQEWPSYDRTGKPLEFDQRPTVRALRSGEPVVGQLVQWRTKTGQLRLLRLTCVPGIDVDVDDVNEAGMVVAFTDVTDEQMSRQLLDVTLEMASAGLAILNVHGEVTRCNPAFAEHAGRSADELVGSSAFDLIHPDDRSIAFDDRDQLLAGASLQTALDHRVQRPDGEERWIHTQITVVHTSTGPIAIASTFDITERRQLLRDISRFSHLFEQSNDMISVIDPTGAVRYSSPAATRILGYGSGSGEPGGVYGPIHHDDRHIAADALARLLSADAPVAPFTARTRTADGRWLHVEYAAVDMLDEPAVEGILITGRDVTQRVELAEQLEYRAGHDTLTKLANRNVIHAALERCLDQRTNSRVGLCFFDLDGFKAINDRHGHAAGDAVLQRVADGLRDTLRPGDMAGRVGGDEFVVVLDPVESRDHAIACAELLRAAVSDIDGYAGLGASVGVVVDRPDDDASSMLRRADAAMYRAKARGGSSISSGTDGAVAEARARGLQPISLHGG